MIDISDLQVKGYVQECAIKCKKTEVADIVKSVREKNLYTFKQVVRNQGGGPDFPKVNSVSQPEFSDENFCAESCLKNAIKK